MRIHSLKSRKFFAIIIAILFVMPIIPVGASPATRERHRQLQEQMQEAQQQVIDQQNLLAGTRQEMSQVLQQMQELDQQLMDAAFALEGIELSLLETEIRIADAEEALSAASDEYDLQFEILRTRVRIMHEQGSMGFLDVLFQAESISDFFARWEYIRVAARFDRDVLAGMQAAQDEISAQIEDLARWRNMITDLQLQHARMYANLEALLREREEWFANLAEDEERFAELLAILEDEQRIAEMSFAEVQTQLRLEEDAIARQRAAEAHNARLAALNDFDGQFQWPIPTHSHISSPFGNRPNPFNRAVQQFHSGIDVPAPTGTPIIAAADGYVRLAGWSGGYGITVIIDHGNGYSTLYAHNSRNRVTVGQRVTRGQHIADVGSTGVSTGPHLHFEIRINNSAVDPMRYFR